MRRLASEIINNLEVRVARLERQTRLASTHKVAGHIVLAGVVSVDNLREDLKRTVGVEDIELDDNVFSFLLDRKNNPTVVREVKSLARKHGLRFEKGELSDGLGMIYTKKASSRRTSRRTASLSRSVGLDLVSMIEDQYNEYGLDEDYIEIEAQGRSRATGSTLMLVSLEGYYGIVRVDGRREDVEAVSNDYGYINKMYQKNLG